jgi:hypothetical protein
MTETAHLLNPMSRGVSQADKIFLAMKSGRITVEGVLQEMNLPPMKKAK